MQECCDSSRQPTAWKARFASTVSLPREWPVMLVEIVHREDGRIWMTCALGVLKSSLKAFLAQGAYLYEFQELPAAIVGIAPTFKPTLLLVKR